MSRDNKTVKLKPKISFYKQKYLSFKNEWSKFQGLKKRKIKKSVKKIKQNLANVNSIIIKKLILDHLQILLL